MKAFLLIIFPFNLIFMHLTLFIIWGFHFTFPHLYQLIFIISVLLSYKKYYKFSLYMILLIIMLPLFTLLTPFEYELSEFIKSYLLLLHSYGFLLLVTFSLYKKPILSINKMFKIFSQVFFIVAAFSIIQSISINVMKIEFLSYPFGSHSYLHQRTLDPMNTSFIGFGLFDWIRIQGFYLEPSILGIILNLGLIFELFLVRKRSLLLITILLIAQLLAFSSSALIFIMLIFLFFIVYKHTNIKIKLISIILAIPIFASLFLGAISRLFALNVVDSSAWRRILFPILIIFQDFNLGFMGHPLGSVQYYIKNSYLDSAYSTIDSGLYLLIFHFGILAILFFAILFFYAIKSFNNDFMKGTLLFFIIYFLFTSNAWTPEFATYVTTIVLFYKLHKYNNSQYKQLYI